MKQNEFKTKLYKRKEIEYFFIDVYIKLSHMVCRSDLEKVQKIKINI